MSTFFDLPMGQSTAAQLADKANIRELVEYERYCRDYHHYDAMRNLYDEDSEVIVSWMRGSGKGFIDASERREGDRPISGGHKLFNTIVWLNGEKALAECLTVIVVRSKLNGIDYDAPAYSRILYRVQKTAGSWKIKRLECIYEFDSIYTGFPVPHPGLFVQEKLDTYRASYKGVSWIEEIMGMGSDQTLPGEDDKASVEAIYQAANEWLFSREE